MPGKNCQCRGLLLTHNNPAQIIVYFDFVSQVLALTSSAG